MAQKPIIDALRAIHWFADLPEPLLEQLAQFSMVRTMRAGETLFCQGEPSPYCFGIVSGEVMIQLVSKDKHVAPKVLSLLGPGSLFGESALFLETKRTAMATGHKDGQVVAIQGTKLREWIGRDAAQSVPLMMGLLQTTMGHLQQTSRELSVVYGIGRLLQTPKPLAERLEDAAHFLQASLDRVGTLVVYRRSAYWEEFEPILVCPKETSAPVIPAASTLVQWAAQATGAIGMASSERRQAVADIEGPWKKHAAVAVVPLVTRENEALRLIGLMVLSSAENAQAFPSSSLLLLSSISNLITEALMQQSRQDDTQAQSRLQQSRQSYPR